MASAPAPMEVVVDEPAGGAGHAPTPEPPVTRRIQTQDGRTLCLSIITKDERLKVQACELRDDEALVWQSHLERNDDMSRLVARLRDPSSAVDAKSDAVGTVVISAKEKDGALFIDMKLRQEGGMRRLLKETKLNPVASPGPALLSTLLLAADHMHAQAEKLAVSDEKIDIYAEENGKLKKLLDDKICDKEALQDELLGKFVLLLNAKKDEIRRLKDRLNEDDDDDEDDQATDDEREEDTLPPPPPPDDQGRGKGRKRAKAAIGKQESLIPVLKEEPPADTKPPLRGPQRGGGRGRGKGSNTNAGKKAPGGVSIKKEFPPPFSNPGVIEVDEDDIIGGSATEDEGNEKKVAADRPVKREMDTSSSTDEGAASPPRAKGRADKADGSGTKSKGYMMLAGSDSEDSW